MSFSYEIDQQNGLVLFTASEVFSNKDLASCVERITADPAFQSHFNHLIDLRNVERFEPRSLQMQSRASRDRTNAKLDRSHIAIVAADDTVYGMARMYQTLMIGADVTVRAFHEMSDALHWLEKPAGPC